jgi:hypothetical protein
MINLYYPFTQNGYLGSNPENKWLTKSHQYPTPPIDPMPGQCVQRTECCGHGPYSSVVIMQAS